MKIFGLTNKYYFLAICLALFGLFLSFSAQAQLNIDSGSILLATNPNFEYVISWRALNYVPANYKGKVLATDNSNIEISFDAVNQGKIVDLSKQKVEWRLNNNIINSGVGLKSIKFTADKSADQVITITVPNYSDAKYKIGELNTSTTISLVPPQLVIKAPYPNRQTTIGEKVFQALPYFFNISNIGQLKISWEVNGQKINNQSASPDIFNILMATQGQAAEGASVSIKAFAQNITNQLEFAQNYINLNIK